MSWGKRDKIRYGMEVVALPGESSISQSADKFVDKKND
jgi:hypothetical protein